VLRSVFNGSSYRDGNAVDILRFRAPLLAQSKTHRS
jgi:hypothetical protein